MLTGIHDLGLFVVAGLLLNITPGPDMAYIAGRAAAGGFRQGAAATLGITAGCVVHTVAAAAGISALVAASASAFTLIKLAGAVYLAWLGIRLLHAGLREPASVASPRAVAPAAPLRIFREGLLINVLNPKVALFYLAFLPQFIAADAPSKILAFAFLGCLFNFNSLFVNLPLAWLAARAGRGLRATSRAARGINVALGGLFVLLAARLAALERA